MCSFIGTEADGTIISLLFGTEFANNEKLLSREYEDAGSMDHCTLYMRIKLMKRERRSARFVLTWNNPNCINYWDPYRDSNGKDIIWKNYYATVFKNSVDSAEYALSKWDELYDKTFLFKDTLYTATLDEAVIDAISANLSILKSPTVIRLQDGSFYGWEECSKRKEAVREHVSMCGIMLMHCVFFFQDSKEQSERLKSNMPRFLTEKHRLGLKSRMEEA